MRRYTKYFSNLYYHRIKNITRATQWIGLLYFYPEVLTVKEFLLLCFEGNITQNGNNTLF